MSITPDWMNYALIDSVTDSFAPIILEIEMEAVSIDELSLVLKKSEQGDMLKRISRCRKKSTQMSRLLGSKLDFIKSLMKRYEDKNREYLEQQQGASFPQQVSNALILATNDPLAVASTNTGSKVNTAIGTPVLNALDDKKAFSDVLLYLGDIQGKIK
jgi:Mg2+ and Co2+ transporter CorA